MVEYICNPSIWESEPKESEVQDHFGFCFGLGLCVCFVFEIETHYVDSGSLEFTEIHLPLPPMYWD